MPNNILYYVALAEYIIYFGKAPACESCHLLPDMIREKLKPKLSLSSLKTEVFLSTKSINSPRAAVAFCEDKKHVPRGDYKILETVRENLS
jgi:hypothetical protein